MMKTDAKEILRILIPSLAVVLLFAASLMYGAVHIPVEDVLDILAGSYEGKSTWRDIILQNRLPQAVTAAVAGACLAVGGLMLQTLFRNPLAGPSILGISDGANLGVAVVMIYLGTSSYFSVIISAFIGASVILALIIRFSRKVRSNVMLLIIGIMVGYLASSVISILNYRAAADTVHQYVMWGMGDFGSVSAEKLPVFTAAASAGLLLSILLIKPMNALLLGEAYAANLGIRIERARVLILLCTGVLTAAVTAFCGPVSFIGLAVPHMARLMLGTSNHIRLVPVTILTGAGIALLCNLLTVLPGGGQSLPLNAITPIICAPVIIYVIVSRKHNQNLF